MRVCHPGPVAFQRAITSAGSRSEMSFLGFKERGRPPFLTLARASISEVSWGSSRYSRAPTTCASIRARSDLKVRREAFFFTVIGFSHAENVASRAAPDVPNYDQASLEMSVTDDPRFAIVFACVLDLNRNACEHRIGVAEIETSFRQGLSTLGRIEGDARELL
jgi:hypothetical protein